MRVIALICAVLYLTGCASTIEVTPVFNDSAVETHVEPFDVDGTLLLADERYDEEQYAEALVAFMNVIENDPQNEHARLGAGESFLALGKFEAAARIFWDEDFTWTNADFETRLEVGKTLSGIYTLKFEDDRSAIHDAMVLAPKDSRLWNAKGRWHDGHSEWMEALNSYVTALEIGKTRSGTINNMGMSLLLQGRRDEAFVKFEQAVQISPGTEIFDNNRRMVLILADELIEALQGIDEKRGADILNDAGFVAFKRDDLGLAERLYEKAIEISPVFHVKAYDNLESLRVQKNLELKSAARSEPATSTP